MSPLVALPVTFGPLNHLGDESEPNNEFRVNVGQVPASHLHLLVLILRDHSHYQPLILLLHILPSSVREQLDPVFDHVNVIFAPLFSSANLLLEIVDGLARQLLLVIHLVLPVALRLAKINHGSLGFYTHLSHSGYFSTKRGLG